MEEDDEKSKLMKSLDKETEFFTSIIDLIPPEHYGYDAETREILRGHKHELIDDKLTQGKISFAQIH